jgi:xanthine dehydrogenase YagT iron-sulfur-binding subunit
MSDNSKKKGCQCNHRQGREEPDAKEHPEGKGFTRRGFLASMGIGAAAVVTAGKVSAAPAPELLKPEELTKIALLINGRTERLLVEPRWSLLYVIREKLGLTGTKVGCERGECGACTVLINDTTHYACLMLAVEAQGQQITTLEGLMKGEELGPVQRAFVEKDAFQCGYCTPGQIMAVEGLLRGNPQPSFEEIRAGVSGNLCRCGAYRNIFEAVKLAAQLGAGKGGKP